MISKKKELPSWVIKCVIGLVVLAIWFPKNAVNVAAYGTTFRVRDVGFFAGLNFATVLKDERDPTGDNEGRKHSRQAWNCEVERATWQARLPTISDAFDRRQQEKYFDQRLKEANQLPDRDFAPSWFFYMPSFGRVVCDVLLSLFIIVLPMAVTLYLKYLDADSKSP